MRSACACAPGASTTATIARSIPVTSINASRRIASLPERSKDSFAPALTIPMVMVFSSTERTCALAESSDQVRRRRFLTFSITSGQKRRSPAISIGPAGLGVAGAGVAAAAAISALRISSEATGVGFARTSLLLVFGWPGTCATGI